MSMRSFLCGFFISVLPVIAPFLLPLGGVLKRNKNQVAPHKESENEISDSASFGIIGESTSGYKNKPHAGYNIDHQSQIKDALSTDSLDSSAILVADAQLDTLKNSEPDSVDLDDCDENYGNYSDEDEYGEYEYEADGIDYDCDYVTSSKFDALDLPPGVEAAIPWLLQSPERPSRKQKEVIEDEIDLKFKSVQQFDIVEDYSDHYYANEEVTAKRMPAKEWANRIQHEWKILEKDLPVTIFVRVYEGRMDLLRAVIIGPAGTPYHDGLFFFDAQFPTSYPNDPPSVYYHSGGLRLNPNLYDNGKVCLSLLGTWFGEGCERWIPSDSTMLQVLVSIQALVLNEKPFFNEPGYKEIYSENFGEKISMQYNESTFVLSCKTMMYSLRRPPKHFEDFVAGHFRERGRTILEACKAYMDGIQVGCTIEEKANDDDEEEEEEGKKTSLPSIFTYSLQKLFEDLLMEFTVKGADCNKFLSQKVKAGRSAGAKAANPTVWH